ncbi:REPRODUCTIVE MERISTEM 39, REDUCED VERNALIZATION RESPONSE 1 [Hibiscus trionum]|uniref:REPRODUCTIVE MERISTEM 39, REDUCED VERNALIZATION RESPONSE 1 n=1 Tax=Hibiscus trionum TaxID=183268 RepID=A0A9W7GZN6_HIBTR|nr:REPRODUCTIVE MERISTEM 39, REDUCED VERNALIZATION RESPONSE 1 [Hibiscus trionum]
MASTSEQQGSGRLKFKSSSPCFFKIILQDTIQNGKLDIPKKFVKNHGKYISSPALLRVPSGEVWKVELTKYDGKLWLENGWLQFSNHYSLDFGHLVVFRYDGNSNFHVVIFDTSASEIHYPLTSNNNERSVEIPEQNIDESQYDDSTQMRKPQLPCPLPHKMMRSTNATIKTETECNEESGFLPQQDGHNGCPARNGDKSTGHKTLRAHVRVDALERASNTFKSENPFFLAVMQPSYVGLGSGKKYRLCIPLNFVKNHLMKEHCSVILCNSSGKTWSVDFKSRRLGTKLRSYLLAGWGTFVRDNNIKAGDVCAFELINSIEISFKVVIYQGQDANCHPSVASTDVFHPVKQETSYASPGCLEPLTSNNNSLSYEIQEQNIDGSKDNETIKILENISPSKKREKSQLPSPRPLKMIRSTNSAIKTEAECTGKSGFVAQQLRLDGNPARQGNKRTSYPAVHRLRNYEKVEALERAINTFKSENPFFLAAMQPYYVGCTPDKKFRLSIPANFAREHLMKEHCSVTLSDSSGKTWTTTLKQSQRGKKLDARLQSGWKTFVQDNNIQVGDVCAFELINSIEISFRVVIYQGQHENYCQSLVSTDVHPVKWKAPSCASPSCHKPLTDFKKAKALPIANAIKSENPFFVIVLQASCVNSHRLSIPANFAREYLTKMHKEVVLLLSNGKSWPVICYQHSIEGSKPNVIFGDGWSKFVVDNNLEVGDACVFELVEGAETSMNVTIYKKQPHEDANLGSSMNDKSREQQVELHERLVIKTEEPAWMEKGDMSNLLVDYNCDASGKILDDFLMSKINSPGKALEEATQSYQTLPENEAFQDTNWLDR